MEDRSEEENDSTQPTRHSALLNARPPAPPPRASRQVANIAEGAALERNNHGFVQEPRRSTARENTTSSASTEGLMRSPPFAPMELGGAQQRSSLLFLLQIHCRGDSTQIIKHSCCFRSSTTPTMFSPPRHRPRAAPRNND